MTCPSALTRSMYADAALTAAESAMVEEHLPNCAACQTRVAALRSERNALRVALHAAEDTAPVPIFSPPLGLRELTTFTLAAVAVSGLASAFWSAVGAAIPSALRWLNPFDSGELFERAINFVTFIIYEGTAMWTSTVNFVGAALLFALLIWSTVTFIRNRAGTAVLLSVLVVVLALPSFGHAFEIRRGSLVTLAAGETVDDTLLAAGETVAIDGDVNGDLLAFGRSITIRGNVTGDLIAGGESIDVEGTIGGNVISFGRGVTLSGTRVARNLYGFGRDLELRSDTEVGGNAIAFGNSIDIDGRVDTDLKGFGANVVVRGTVQGDMETFAGDVTLLPSARIGGNVIAHLDDPDDLQIAAGAVVGGSIDRPRVAREQRRNAYLTVGFYVRQVVRLGAAFLTGLALLWLFPTLRTLTLPNGGAVLRAGGIGLATAVALPVAALLACITIIGLPLGMATFALGALALYFAKTVVAQLIGRAIFRAPAGPPHYAATLIAGLMIVIITINVPFVGGFVNVVLTLVGLGMIVSQLLGKFGGGASAA